MRSSFLCVALAALGMVLLNIAAPCYGDDFLVIRKKDGTTQKVPLRFNPDEIDSFDVEATPGRVAPPGVQPEQERPAQEAEGKPLQITPGARDRRAPEVSPQPRRPLAEQPPLTPTPQVLREEKAPAKPPEIPRTTEARPPVTRGPVSTAPAGKTTGAFLVNVYKLPDSVKTLPDYSAFRPEKVISSDKINLQPVAGERDPANIPENTDGMGLRFMGVFQVTGEGIFRWRVNSKDGVRLHIDDKTLIENDGIHPPASKVGFTHLAEGVHTIVVDSFNSTGQPVLQLFVAPPVGSEELFSMSKGLVGWKEPQKPYDVLWGQVYFVPKGNYPQGPDFNTITPVGRLIASELNIAGGESFPGLPGRRDMVGLRYEGFFNVEGAGIFAFRLRTDNVGKLTVGKHEIVSIADGQKTNPDGKLGWAFLQKGSYPIGVEYFHREGEPRLQLFVTQPMKEEKLFSPSETLQGYAGETGQVNMIPAFVYFLKPGTKQFPNFNKLSPSGMYFTKAIDYPVDRGSKEFPGVPKRENWLGIRFYVKFALSDKEEGLYKFRIVANDSARLIIGNKLVVNAEGHGNVAEKSGTVTMNAGSHEMFLDYFQSDGPNGVQLFITAPESEEKVFAFQ